MDQLISIKMNDGYGQYLRVIDWITSFSRSQCGAFAHKLLKDPVVVQKLQRKYSDVDDFVPAVLSDWLSRHDPADEAVPRTWGALAVCVEEAGLDGTLAKSIRDNCPQGVLHEAVLSLIYTSLVEIKMCSNLQCLHLVLLCGFLTSV